MLNAEILIGIIVATITIVGIWWLLWWPGWRARRILRSEFPAPWHTILCQRVGFYPTLPPALQTRLRDLIQLFLHDKAFTGAAELEITDTIRVVIAAQACLLVLGRTIDEYARLKTIIVYPSSYLTPTLEGESASVRLGESWHNGRVILAWDEVAGNSFYQPAGHNVGAHEFAHQLDQEDGYADGVPNIPAWAVACWSQTFSNTLSELREDLAAHRATYLNPYGATNEAEFFAVCSEAYFSDTVNFSTVYPQLYDLLRAFYRIDPLAWRQPNTNPVG